MSNRHDPEPYFTCPECGKRSYDSRASAKRAGKALAKAKPWTAKGLSEYECRAGGRGWHVGHLAPAIARGEKTIDEVYGT